MMSFPKWFGVVITYFKKSNVTKTILYLFSCYIWCVKYTHPVCKRAGTTMLTPTLTTPPLPTPLLVLNKPNGVIRLAHRELDTCVFFGHTLIDSSLRANLIGFAKTCIRLARREVVICLLFDNSESTVCYGLTWFTGRACFPQTKVVWLHETCVFI